MHGLGSDKEIVVIVDDESEQNQSGHAGNNREKGLDFGRLTPHP